MKYIFSKIGLLLLAFSILALLISLFFKKNQSQEYESLKKYSLILLMAGGLLLFLGYKIK